MKTICAMQPYIFPYLPYYQLAEAVDEFWVLDDVQFIRRGWMTRNDILLGGRRHRISFPVVRGQQSDLICEKTLPPEFGEALSGLTTTLHHAYGKAPQFDQLAALLEPLRHRSWHRYLEFALHTLRQSFDELGLATPLYLSSSLDLPTDLRGADRIVEICARSGAGRYVNPEGGKALYTPAPFTARGVELCFLQGRLDPYPQLGGNGFEPGLSILDLIAHVPASDLAGQLLNHTIVKG